MTHPHPQLGFPVYGLLNWDGPQWLDFVEGQAERAPWAIWLAHGTPRSPHLASPWVRVGSFAAQDHVPLVKARSETSAQALSFAALVVLINLTMPDLDDQLRAAYMAQVSIFLKEQSEAATTWLQTIWNVDGHNVDARVFSWAGAWVGFSMDPDAASIVVLGAKFPFDEIVLQTLTSGSDYHFALDRVVDAESSILKAMGEGFKWGKWPLHPDQQLLLDQG